MSTPLLALDAVSKDFHTPSGKLRAVDSVSFDVREGECLGNRRGIGLRQEHGSPTLVLGIYGPTEGDIRYRGDLLPARRELVITARPSSWCSRTRCRRSIRDGRSVLPCGLPSDVHDIGEKAAALGSAWANCLRKSACPATTAPARRPPCRAANASVWRLPGRSHASPILVVLDEPTSALDRARPGTGAEAAERICAPRGG